MTRLLKASEILLESPEEVQTRGTYQCPDGKMCAMGILLKLCGWKGYYSGTGEYAADQNHKSYLKAIVNLREWFGIDETTHNEIIALNDQETYSLSAIGN